MKNKIYLKTAEFAFLCGTTKNTLIHYDEIGLLKPHYVAENKYRYYNVNQVEEYFAIAGLRDLGFSLQHIKAKLQSSSLNSYCELLEQQQEIIESKIASLEQVKESISTHISEIKLYLDSGLNKVSIKKMPPKALILSPDIVDLESPPHFIHYYSELIGKLKTKTQNTYCRYGAIKTREQIEKNQNYTYQNIYIHTTKEMSTHVVPSGTYLITYEKTDFENVLPAYERLITHARKNNIQLDTLFYEEVIIHQMNLETKYYIAQVMCRIL